MPKVLLADSSVTIQKVVELVLGDKGYEVKAVATGGEALAALSAFNPDIVLADVNLPDINGYELTEKVRENENTKDIPVILLAGAFSPVDEERKSRIGANAALTKPFEANDLLSKLGALLESPSAAGVEAVETVEAVEASVDDESVTEAVEVTAEEELMDLAELDEEPVEVEVVEEPAEGAVEASMAEAAEETSAKAEPATPTVMPAIEVPGKDEILSVVRDSVSSKLGDALSNMDATAKDAVSEHISAALGGIGQSAIDTVNENISAALSGIDQAIKDSVNENLSAALSGIDDAVRNTVTESLNNALGGIEQQILESLNRSISEALDISALKNSLMENMKATVDKVLREAAPELTQDLVKETLSESIGSLKGEVEKVIWETVPDLAESIIKSEIEKIRSGS